MADTIRDRLKEAEFIHSDDRVAIAAYRHSDGAAKARVRLGAPLSNWRLTALDQSDTWRLVEVDPAGGDTTIELLELLDEPRDRPAADGNTA